MIGILATMVGDTNATEAALAFIALFGAWAVIVTQRKGIVDWGAMFKDDAGKTSSQRVMGVCCFIIASWSIIDLTTDAVQHQDALEPLFRYYTLYVLVFAGTPIAGRILELLGQFLALKNGVPPTK